MYSPEWIAAWKEDQIGHLGFLLEFYLDSGTMYLTTFPNGINWNGNDYEYFGEIGGLSNTKEGEELDPQSYSIQIGAVDPVILAKFINEPIMNRQCIVREVIGNEDQTLKAEPEIFFSGSFDSPSVNDGQEASITLPVNDDLSDWDRNIESRYTDAEQRRLHPDDFCLEHVSEIKNATKIWPASTWEPS